MSFTKEEREKIIFDIALQMGKKFNLIGLDEYLLAKYDIGDGDMEKACAGLNLINQKYHSNQPISYMEFEDAIRNQGFSISKAKIIIGIFYVQDSYRDVIEGWENPPMELKTFIRTANIYEKSDCNLDII